MRNDFASNYLEHSAKGTTWKKNTKYVKRVWKNGRWEYYYPDSENGIDRYLGTERKIAERDSQYYKMKEDGTWDKYKKYYKNGYSSDKADIYKGMERKVTADANDRAGANGMPSSIARKQKISADMALEDAANTYEAKKAIEQINKELEIYSKGANGMPTDVIKKNTKHIKKY